MSTSMDAFDVLLDLEKKCKTHAKPLPMQDELGQSWAGVGFIAGHHHFVSPIEEIKEIIPLSQETLGTLTKLPDSAEWLMGMINLRGKVLPVTDLENFIINQKQTTTPASKILVVDFEQSVAGFVVTQVLGVRRFSEKPNTIIQDEDKNEGREKDKEIEAFKPYLQGWFKGEEHNWTILSFSAIVASPDFYHVVKELGAK